VAPHLPARRLAAPLCALGLGCSSEPPAPAPTTSNAGTARLVAAAPGNVTLLLFTRAEGFRHQSISSGIEAMRARALQRGWGLDATEDAAELTDEKLAAYAAVVFLNTTGDVLDSAQQAAFERYIAAGHGFVGVHAAADCEYEWPWYGGLVGAYFAGHSEVTTATLTIEPVQHPAALGLPSPWTRKDEWYGFRHNPRGNVTVLLAADETSFDPGPGAMGGDHPLAWFHDYAGGRAFYTALGHTAESYGEEPFMAHLTAGVAWAAGSAQ
jgi:cytochrome c